jgi:hypothetical protein
VNNVIPNPSRGAFTGLTGSEGLFEVPGPVDPPGFFSGGLLEVPGLLPLDGRGRLRLGLLVVSEAGAFSFGRVVRNAPRTSSS